jgi:hypothetical protein
MTRWACACPHLQAAEGRVGEAHARLAEAEREGQARAEEAVRERAEVRHLAQLGFAGLSGRGVTRCNSGGGGAWAEGPCCCRMDIGV